MELFQYHKGAIQSRPDDELKIEVIEFQYHKGAIQRRKEALRRARLKRFQYHKGAIQSLSVGFARPLEVNFNTTRVRFRAVRP